ncbi:ABC transporter ATP-binding protein [Frisingicoccus sp.]|uniref:ABC transporter ATP-binding protein n=1 Tax=Frisingicoccus sp. TaxID=1918627 RepID=UPI003AB14ABA
MEDKEIIVQLKNVNKSFGDNQVVKNLNIDIYKGEFLTILGSSGCGKTTTLRMIAGFETQTSGEIFVNGKEVRDEEPYEREVNTVFQNYALFPHMTIYENVAFGLTMKKIPKDEIKKKVTHMLELVQLSGFESRKPDQLSGGQKQRVAIARALVNEPKVLLLDEPLGALDLKLRKQMQFELKRLQKKLGITFIYVTHDQEEALTMSDRIAIMNKGNLEQLSVPRDIYEHPATEFVADFIGESNIFYGVVDEKNASDVRISLENGLISAGCADVEENEIVYVSVRPENTAISECPVDGFELSGIIREHVYVGSLTKTIVELFNGNQIKINTFSKQSVLPEGMQVYVYWNPEDAVVIKSQSNVIFGTIENINFGSGE